MTDAPLPNVIHLRTEQIIYAGLTELDAAPDAAESARVYARMICDIFNDYYQRSREIPWQAKIAFETRNWPYALQLSQERIAMFGQSARQAAPLLRLYLGTGNTGFWRRIEKAYAALVSGRYEADLAHAYLNALRRQLCQDSWTTIDHDETAMPEPPDAPDFLTAIPVDGIVDAKTVETVFTIPDLAAPYRDIAGDASAVAARLAAAFGPVDRLDVATSGFYRNRGAYIIGAAVKARDYLPFAIALLHREQGIYVDAVLAREPDVRHIFSSTLANFHVTITDYHALAAWLHKLMPARPVGLHYSTVGYNHVGKIAVMRDILQGLKAQDEMLDFAPGPRGSVAIGFTAPGLDYVLKVIRDTPTDNYKWETYDGPEAVLGRYRQVHGINRSSSMLDNVIYTNVILPVQLFSQDLLDELMAAAGSNVSLYRSGVFFRHLIVQRKLVPVPIFLETATPEQAEKTVIKLGQCIRNNASAGIFNRDLDGRNYGVSTLGNVYLFDYDALEHLVDITVDSNLDREEGEDDIPDWVFASGTVFLPEELEVHLNLPDRQLRRLFREAHGALLTKQYWLKMQNLLRDGKVPIVRTYPRSCELRPPEA